MNTFNLQSELLGLEQRQIMVIQPTCLKLDCVAAMELMDIVKNWLSANDLISSEYMPTLLVDMKKVEVLDSNGLGCLLSVLKLAIAASSNLVLCSLQAPVRLVFEITKMDRTFAIFADRQDFLSHLTASAELYAAYKGDRLLAMI